MTFGLTEKEITELQTHRKELVLRGIVVLAILLVAVICMVVLEVNSVGQGNSNRFRVISLALIAGLYAGYIFPLQKYPRFLRSYPDVVRERPWKYPLPVSWHVLRATIFLASLVVLLFAFQSSNKPQTKPFEPRTVQMLPQPTSPTLPSEVEEIIESAESGSQ